MLKETVNMWTASEGRESKSYTQRLTFSSSPSLPIFTTLSGMCVRGCILCNRNEASGRYYHRLLQERRKKQVKSQLMHAFASQETARRWGRAQTAGEKRGHTIIFRFFVIKLNLTSSQL